MENTYSSVKNGGIKKDNLIPNLTRISKENVNFSNGGELGGALSINGSAWTAAAMVSQTSGLPLKINSSSNGIIDFNNFMPNVTTLGDILEDNGYNNYLLVGSDSTYGSRKTYFEQHGNYSVYDVNSAIDDKVIREDEKVWWGFDDNLLFELAKEKLLEISSNDEPFNYTMLTVDTHFEDGYLADDCDEKFNDQYSDVMYCADRKINEFLEWIKEQDFYENTTVILVGDHLSMDVDYFDDVEDDYVRTTYNAFINPLCDTDRCSGKKTNREFTSLDMFPTTLASLGVKIDGERLALGTNLFSLKKTIVEEYGYEHVFNELKLRSSFYNDNFLAYK